MRNEKMREHKREGRHHGERHRGREHGPKTFRRGRALAFLELLNLKRSTIKDQLEKPEFQSINQILVGELKPIDLVINEFIQMFELQEKESAEMDGKESLDRAEKGADDNETN